MRRSRRLAAQQRPGYVEGQDDGITLFVSDNEDDDDDDPSTGGQHQDTEEGKDDGHEEDPGLGQEVAGDTPQAGETSQEVDGHSMGANEDN